MISPRIGNWQPLSHWIIKLYLYFLSFCNIGMVPRGKQRPAHLTQSNSMVADVMATWRSSASAFMILLVFIRYPAFRTTRVNATLADLFDPIMPYWPTFVLVMYWWGQPIPHIIFARVLNQKNNNIIVSVSTVLHNGLYIHISPCYGLF